MTACWLKVLTGVCLHDALTRLAHLSAVAAQTECGRTAASNRVLLRSWRSTAPASAAAAMISGHAAVLDFAPALAALSRPAGLKAVSRQLMSTQQAALLDHSVSVVTWAHAVMQTWRLMYGTSPCSSPLLEVQRGRVVFVFVCSLAGTLYGCRLHFDLASL